MPNYGSGDVEAIVVHRQYSVVGLRNGVGKEGVPVRGGT
jgi:hypothetical protein